MGFPPQYGEPLGSIRTSPNGSILLGAQNEGLLRSTDMGGTWEIIHPSSSLGEEIVFATTTTGVIIAEANYQFVRSTNNGTSWASLPL